MFTRRRARYLLLIPIVALAYLGVLQWSGNFHEIIPGELYRSAQLEPGDIAHYSQKYKLRSVLNLRGENYGSPWYDAEVREAAQIGVQHIDFRMSSSKELDKEQVFALIDVMRQAPKPMLIHCRAGADRTGLAAAFYLAGIANRSEMSSEMQLWPIYGHLPFSFLGAFAMNRTFETFEPYLGFTDS